MMTIPFRPAPPPPTSANIQNNFQTNNNNHNTAVAHQQQQLLQSTTSESQVGRKKNPPPPRPPPPKLGHKSRRREQSVNIFSNLFGTAGRSAAIKSTIGHQRTAEFSNSHKTELPFHSSATCHNNGASIELISFDSPPSSPQFTQKFGDNERTSSANSFESNKSISYYSNSSGFSSASGGGSGSAISSLNNGFEDDFFSLANGRTSSSSTATTSQAVDPYEFIYSNDFPTPSSSSTFYTATDSTINRKKFPVEFNDSLCNGKSLLAPEPALAMPTIIRPAATKPKSLNKQSAAMVVPLFPKSMSVVGKQATQTNDRDVEASYGIALFDFDAGQMGDLSLKQNDKIYLLKRVDDEWYYGKNKRGCEGIFPISHISVIIPIGPNIDGESSTASVPCAVTNDVTYTVKAMYDFIAETVDDLTIMKNDIITVLYEVNAEWLYGTKNGNDKGQFPKNFVETVGR